RHPAHHRSQPEVAEELQDRAGTHQEPEDAGGDQHEPAAAHPTERPHADGDRPEHSRAAANCRKEEGSRESYVSSSYAGILNTYGYAELAEDAQRSQSARRIGQHFLRVTPFLRGKRLRGLRDFV